jgi:Ribbon-helix-helix protein, copG family
MKTNKNTLKRSETSAKVNGTGTATKTPVLSLAVTQDVIAAIDLMAEREGRSRSNMAFRLLQIALNGNLKNPLQNGDAPQESAGGTSKSRRGL